MCLKIQQKPSVRRTCFHFPSIYSPSQKPFGVIPQAHSLNLRWLLVFGLHEGRVPAFSLWGLWWERLPRKGRAAASGAPICLWHFLFPHKFVSLQAWWEGCDIFSWGGWEGKEDRMSWDTLRRRKWGQSSLKCCTKGLGPQNIQQEPSGGITPGHSQRCISCPTLRKDSFCHWNITGSFRKPYLLVSWDV